jgi:hypothetical protein
MLTGSDSGPHRPSRVAACPGDDVAIVYAFQKNGAANGIRTRDPKIHNLVL